MPCPAWLPAPMAGYHFAPQHGSNNFFNIGITCHHFERSPCRAPRWGMRATRASREAIAKAPNTTDPLLAPHYPAIKGQNLRGFGWDIDTALSTTRGGVFPSGSVR